VPLTRRDTGEFVDSEEYARLVISGGLSHFVDRATPDSLVIGLHRAAQLALPVVVAGVGLPTLAATTGQTKAYAERLFTFPQIGSLTDAQAIEALQQHAKDGGIVWSDDALAFILQVTQCYPYFIQQFGLQARDIADGPRGNGRA
jgi:hypothetical protein